MRVASAFALILAAIGALPMLLLVIAGLASHNGCPADRGDILPCPVLGVDIGPILADIAPVAYLSIISWPLLLGGLALFVLLKVLDRRPR